MSKSYKNLKALARENAEWKRHLAALKAKGKKPHPVYIKVHEERVAYLSGAKV